MTPDELSAWVRGEVESQTQLLRDQIEVLRHGFQVLDSQVDHLQRVLEMVGTLAGRSD